MSRFVMICAVVAFVVAGGGAMVARGAQSATPVAAGGERLVLIEHAVELHDIDQGEPGPSVGDMQIWGPNPLYDEQDGRDTGATTQGTCIALNAAHDCIVTETILFPDGSTLQIQGVELASGESTRTIVGGSGRYLGATGSVVVEPTADQSRWQKTIEIAGPESR
jgi:hypothetical protein